MTSVSDAERRQRLASRHRLVPGRRLSAAEPESLATIADDVVALHASDPATVYLTAAARLNEPSVDAVASSLYESRRLVRHHAMRRTIWVMSHAVLPVAHRSTTLKIAQAERRRLLNVLDRNDRWLDAAIEEIAALTREHGPSQTRTIGQLLPHLAFEVTVGSATKHPATVRAHTRVVVQGGFEGKLCRTRPVGSWTASTYAWVAAEAWHDHDLSSMGTDPTRQREAKADLVERWLLRFGPGTETDISWWTGMTKTDVRNALSDTGAQEVDLASGTGWLSGADTAVAAGAEQASAAEPWE